VEQTLNQRNSSWNRNGTCSLKAMANKLLERNKGWNTYGTAASKSVPPPDQPIPLRGTSLETNCVPQHDDLSFAFEERAAIAEIDGHQTPAQAHRIAYLDMFICLLSSLFEDASHRNWLNAKIQTAHATLEAQRLPTLT